MALPYLALSDEQIVEWLGPPQSSKPIEVGFPPKTKTHFEYAGKDKAGLGSLTIYDDNSGKILFFSGTAPK